MNRLRMITALCIGLALSACATVDTATRNSRPELLPSAALPVAPTLPSVNVVDVRVTVPQSLHATEANGYYPKGDIVWREDPMGDRHKQVQTIFESALNAGTRGLDGIRPVVLDVTVQRFHALSEKARYTVGGKHEFEFTYVLRDPTTGAAVSEPKFAKIDFKAYGGSAAISAERAGKTQKYRITNFLAGYFNQQLGGAPQAVNTGAAQKI